MARVLVTGATGHVGAAVVRSALRDGHEVRVLVRATSETRGLDGLPVERVEGDLLDAESLGAACDGCEVVLHVAAVHRNWAAREEDILGPAITGTENVLRAAKAAGVRRVVITSSNAAVGYGDDPARPLDERSWNAEPHAVYIRAKTLAERRGLELGRELGVEVVSVLPCGVVGPYDLRRTPTTKSILAIAGGGPSVLDVAVTDVRDVADGVLLAASRGRAGERYLLSGQNCSKEELAAIVGGLTGRTVKAMLPPRFVMRALACVGEVRARLGGPDPDITRAEILDVCGRHLLYDSQKARTELGWSPRPAVEAVGASLRWAVDQGWLGGEVAQSVRARVPAASTAG